MLGSHALIPLGLAHPQPPQPVPALGAQVRCRDYCPECYSQLGTWLALPHIILRARFLICHRCGGRGRRCLSFLLSSAQQTRCRASSPATFTSQTSSAMLPRQGSGSALPTDASGGRQGQLSRAQILRAGSAILLPSWSVPHEVQGCTAAGERQGRFPCSHEPRAMYPAFCRW